MTTFTNYHIINAKKELIATYHDEESAIKHLNKGLAKGWKWMIEVSKWEVEKPEIWELAGCKQDESKIYWDDKCED